MKRKMLAVLLWLVKVAALVAAIIVLLLFVFQAKLIYHPQPYRPDYARLIPARGVEVEYRTSAGRQTAFYIPPRAADDPTTIPKRLWVMFGGNASLALFWADTVRDAPDPDAAFLLVDYPGYGKCEGSPSPRSIQESSETALTGLAEWMKCDRADLERDLNVAGHSLGAAASLQFAVKHKIQRILLVAPFTSMREMVRQVMGRAFTFILLHNYDNRKRLDELAAGPQPPHVIILHGDSDTIIPSRMSRELTAAHPQMIELHEIPRADHVNVLDYVLPYLASR
jgi:pimeloyl-ACP methyl ester carboxylesterase